MVFKKLIKIIYNNFKTKKTVSYKPPLTEGNVLSNVKEFKYKDRVIPIKPPPSRG